MYQVKPNIFFSRNFLSNREVWFPDLDLILISLISKNQENLISWSPHFFKSRNPDLQILISWSRPDLERINGQLNKGKKSSNLMKSIREKIILLQYVHEFLKLLGKRLCLFDMSFYKFAKRLYLYKSLFPLGSFINIHFDDNYLSQ